MTTLSQNQQREWQAGDTEAYPVVAADIIYQGAAVGENAAGYSRPLVALDVFQGFAIGKVDNSTGSAGAESVDVRTRGRVTLNVAGATAITTNDRQAVYASDDNAFTLTALNNSLIGYVSRWISSGVCVVEFDAMAVKAALQV